MLDKCSASEPGPLCLKQASPPPLSSILSPQNLIMKTLRGRHQPYTSIRAELAWTHPGLCSHCCFLWQFLKVLEKPGGAEPAMYQAHLPSLLTCVPHLAVDKGSRYLNSGISDFRGCGFPLHLEKGGPGFHMLLVFWCLRTDPMPPLRLCGCRWHMYRHKEEEAVFSSVIFMVP